MSEKEKLVCDYYGCNEEIAKSERRLKKHTMKFCKTHKEESDKAIDDGAMATFSFWMRASGGPKKLTKRIFNEKEATDE